MNSFDIGDFYIIMLIAYRYRRKTNLVIFARQLTAVVDPEKNRRMIVLVGPYLQGVAFLV